MVIDIRDQSLRSIGLDFFSLFFRSHQSMEVGVSWEIGTLPAGQHGASEVPGSSGKQDVV
jgi:hypothetical protein